MFVNSMLENLRKNMKWFDISLIKLATFFSALLLAKLWNPLLSLDWYWYALLIILVSIRPMIILFKK